MKTPRRSDGTRLLALSIVAAVLLSAPVWGARFIDYSGSDAPHAFKSLLVCGTVRGCTGPEITRASATAFTVPGLTISSGGVLTTTGATIVRTSQTFQAGFGTAKAGATAGWVVAAGANLYEWTLPASQTASTLVVPISGLHVGDTITAYSCQAQIESAGGAVTLDTNLRKLTNVAADPTDASVASTTQVSVTADTAAAPAAVGIADVIGTDERFYVLITATTAASADIRALGCNVTVTTS